MASISSQPQCVNEVDAFLMSMFCYESMSAFGDLYDPDAVILQVICLTLILN